MRRHLKPESLMHIRYRISRAHRVNAHGMRGESKMPMVNNMELCALFSMRIVNTLRHEPFVPSSVNDCPLFMNTIKPFESEDISNISGLCLLSGIWLLK